MCDDQSVELDDQLKTMARGALESDKAFERFGWQLFELVPQLDRICVTEVKGGKLRLKKLHERLGVRTALKSKSTRVRAKGQSLASYAAHDQVVVNTDLTGTNGSIMAGMSRKDIRSSMHVPVVIDGVRSTVNFWSAEAGGFPRQAAKLLEQVARLMTDATKVAQK